MTDRPKTYRVEKANTIDELETMVSTRMVAGWVPVGALTIEYSGKFVEAYLQALMRVKA